MEGGGPAPAGSSRTRLDPFSLPVRFRAADAGADEHLRDVELYRERVVVRRRIRGIPMALNVPVTDFLGVALSVTAPTEDTPESVHLTLEHPDPGLSIPLFDAPDSDEVVAEWQTWARVLRRPLLVTDDNGGLHEPFPHIGQVRAGAVSPRRRGRTALKSRRPSIRWRRRCGMVAATPTVHSGEREIIARN